MRDILPVTIEDRQLPIDSFRKKERNSYGYVSFLYLLSAMITVGSVLVVIFLGNR